MSKRTEKSRQGFQPKPFREPSSNTTEEQGSKANQQGTSEKFYFNSVLACPVSHDFLMRSKTLWSKYYRRDISVEETLEIIGNMQSFVLTVLEEKK